jgi:hypothetical protein|tara:strand:+ start:151 stop:312 length:162 start_codon:yes stop_codon:yes gene_type:complete
MGQDQAVVEEVATLEVQGLSVVLVVRTAVAVEAVVVARILVVSVVLVVMASVS